MTTSPLSRARETGAILAEGLGIPLLGSYAAFREQEYGAAEGLPQGQLDALLAAGNVPGMETPAQVAERGLAELGRLRHEHAGAIIVVSHGGTIRRIISTLARLPRQDIPRIDNLGISLLADDPATTPTMDNPAGWQVETINGIPLADAVTHTEG